MSDGTLSLTEGMHREQFTPNVSNVDWLDEDADPRLPTFTVVFEGEAETLRQHVVGPGGEDLDSDETDVTARLHEQPEDPDAEAVVSVTNRVTGEYMLECNISVDELLSFLAAARRYGERTDGSARYRVRVATPDGDRVFVHEKRTLLVYSDKGELLRGHSLIPSGVEI